ncbi:MAG: inositol monophosphatase family protein [Phycisphaerae bacterium]
MSPSALDPVEPQSLQALREVAESAARVGGELARASFGQTVAVTLKADRSEVTEIDVAAQRAIIAHIRSHRPGDSFIGEEAAAQRHEGTKGRRHEGKGAAGPSRDTRAPRDAENPHPAIRDPQSICWVIDPLDGTRNYVRGLPLFTCSVAALRNGEPLVGAVYDPVQDVMYAAARGQGTYVQGQRVSLASVANAYGPGADLLVGIPSAQRPTTQHLVLHAIERHTVRNFGSAALHLALVATGQLDVAVLGNSKLWDVAAGWLLITEAGGVATSPDGAPVFPLDVSGYAGEEIAVLAGNRAAHARLMRESAAG